MTKAFVSYSWDSEPHKSWVRDLAERLRQDGIDVTLDQWHLVPGDQLPSFMETAVKDSDFVLIICTRRYKQRSDARAGGVGYEGDIMSGQVLTGASHRKFIPILRESPWDTSAPMWVAGKYYIDMTADPYPESQYTDLLTTMLGTREPPPPVGAQSPSRIAQPARASKVPIPASIGPDQLSPAFKDIKVTGVVVDQVSVPRMDGTPGSALYDVPFRLSRHPPREWVDFLIGTWNAPPRFTTMHRPGIASVAGDIVHLKGTTVEEVQRYHRDTLILAAQEANKRYAQLLESQARQQELERARVEQHKRDVEDRAKGIKFD